MCSSVCSSVFSNVFSNVFVCVQVCAYRSTYAMLHNTTCVDFNFCALPSALLPADVCFPLSSMLAFPHHLTPVKAIACTHNYTCYTLLYASHRITVYCFISLFLLTAMLKEFFVALELCQLRECIEMWARIRPLWAGFPGYYDLMI